MLFINSQNKSPLQQNSSQKISALLIFILISFSVFFLTACGISSSPTTINTPQKKTTSSPQVVATALTAELIGKLSIVDGCVRVNIEQKNVSYLLVWPPDITATVGKETVQIITGVTTGNQKTTMLHNGEEVRVSGGETAQPGLNSPPNCLGPYWVVGFEIGSK